MDFTPKGNIYVATSGQWSCNINVISGTSGEGMAFFGVSPYLQKTFHEQLLPSILALNNVLNSRD